MAQSDFNQHSKSYNENLNKGLSFSGESQDYFSEKRIVFLKEYLKPSFHKIKSIVEFGCGVGNNIQFLNQYFPNTHITGLDISAESLQIAKKRYDSHTNVSFKKLQDTDISMNADLIFVNGVFHHIPHHDHPEILKLLHTMLNANGHLCLFENNPFNPGARWVMKHIPFDKNAVMINPYKLRQHINSFDYLNVELKFHFVFPRALKCLRFIEKPLINWPLGAQYCILAAKH